MANSMLAFLSVPRMALRITGPFEDVLRPLLDKLEVPHAEDDKLVVPCLEQQLSSILTRFPGAVILQRSQCAQAQTSMHTVTLSPKLDFPYHMKFALACKITSAMRTIAPWTACGGISMSRMLEDLLPSDVWVFREVASVCGSQDDFDEAEHLTCMLREDLESRADARGERLIMAATLTQDSGDDARCWAEKLFGLRSIAKRRDWFKSYTQCLFKLTISPLANHGICLEAHGQNVVGRFCRESGALKGFAIRDYGGLKLHMPTLRKQGYDLDVIPPGSTVKVEDLQEVWTKAHHALIQTHLGHLMAALQLEAHGGWKIVREQLLQILASDEIDNRGDICDFFTRDTMSFKCCVEMKLVGESRENV